MWPAALAAVRLVLDRLANLWPVLNHPKDENKALKEPRSVARKPCSWRMRGMWYALFFAGPHSSMNHWSLFFANSPENQKHATKFIQVSNTNLCRLRPLQPLTSTAWRETTRGMAGFCRSDVRRGGQLWIDRPKHPKATKMKSRTCLTHLPPMWLEGVYLILKWNAQSAFKKKLWASVQVGRVSNRWTQSFISHHLSGRHSWCLTVHALRELHWLREHQMEPQNKYGILTINVYYSMISYEFLWYIWDISEILWINLVVDYYSCFKPGPFFRTGIRLWWPSSAIRAVASLHVRNKGPCGCHRMSSTRPAVGMLGWVELQDFWKRPKKKLLHILKWRMKHFVEMCIYSFFFKTSVDILYMRHIINSVNFLSTGLQLFQTGKTFLWSSYIFWYVFSNRKVVYIFVGRCP